MEKKSERRRRQSEQIKIPFFKGGVHGFSYFSLNFQTRIYVFDVMILFARMELDVVNTHRGS